MTSWQWQVVVALCKCVLHLYKYCDIKSSPELTLLKETVDRESNNAKAIFKTAEHSRF